MIVAVSPYHLTTREPPAMAALLIAERVVTLVPSPVDTSSVGARAAARVPTYARLMKSWEWTEPLWREGVLRGEIGGASAVADMWDVSQQIAADESLAALRPFVKHDLYECESQYLGAVAADLLKGGPDPGILLPVAAGIDRFACRHGALVARGAGSSVAQRAEARLARPAASLSVPILLQADAARLLHAREVLADALGPLRCALAELAMAPGEPESSHQSSLARSAARAAVEYAAAFDARREVLEEGRRDDDVRLVEGHATIVAVALPADAVLRSSLAAMESVHPAVARRAAAPGAAPVVADPWATRPVLSLVVKPLGG